MAQQRSTAARHPAAEALLALGLAVAIGWAGPARAQPTAAAACPALLDHRFSRLQDEVPQDLCQYQGRVLLIVNTASYCGYTPQYEGLEKIYSQYAGRGLTILGFPSNDFGGQEPKAGKEIADFCFNTYGVKFPMLGKSSVAGQSANPLFVALAKQSGEAPKWNFHKYLVDRDGRVVASFGSRIEPTDRQITSRIEQLLTRP